MKSAIKIIVILFVFSACVNDEYSSLQSGFSKNENRIDSKLTYNSISGLTNEDENLNIKSDGGLKADNEIYTAFNVANKNKNLNKKSYRSLNIKNNSNIVKSAPLKLKPLNFLSEVFSSLKQKTASRTKEDRLLRPIDSNNFSDLSFKPLHKTSLYKTSKQHTLIVELTNKGDQLDLIKQSVVLPKKWKLVSMSSVESVNKNGKNLLFISFFIPSNFPVGIAKATLQIKNNLNTVLGSFDVQFTIAKNTSLKVFNIYAPQHVEAGKLIETSFAIENKGNITQEISLKSRNTLVGKSNFKIAPDSTIVVKVNQKTNLKTYSFRRVGAGVEVLSKESKKVMKSYKSIAVFPIKIKQKDPFFRFPVSASLYYNSYTTETEHYAAMSAEIAGNGFLDVKKNHYLDFIVRGPKEMNRKRFSVVDQYSFIYSYKDNTTIYLGDHAYQINRLGFTNKYGMGFKIDQRVNNVELSAFYTKPRLYDYNSGAVYGVKATYFATDKITGGISLTRSEKILQANKSTTNPGQIVTLNFDYKDKTTSILGESSTSFSNSSKLNGAGYLSISKRFKKFTYFGNYIVASEDYLGAISNSLQISNNLSYAVNKWAFGVGHTTSKINKKLDPLFYASEPFYESLNASLNYRVSKNNTIRLSVYNRKRQDRLVPVNYDYNERGFKYSYSFKTLNRSFSGNFNGRIAKTKNLLSTQVSYRDTYANNLNISYRFANKFNLRAKFSHNYNNRYGVSNINTNYFRYGAGFSYSATKNFNINANYNSGFSPEKMYLKRDFINLNMMAKLSKNHKIEFRANYFENPGETNKKQVLAFAKYTFTFGVPLKKVIKQGGLIGNVFSLDTKINTKGIKIIAAGKTVLTDKNGNFELNNLALGKNYILVDQSTLENGVITAAKIPYEVIIKDNKQAKISIELVKSASLEGAFWVDLNKLKYRNKEYNLQGYIKIQNKDFTYYTSISKKGEFKFQEIVPGNYKLTILSFSSGSAQFNFDNNIQLFLKENEITLKKIELKLKERKIKFKNKNFKIGK
ncbi:hypothetical protein KCTC32516_01321 [Polaribacter huanghezhanensis]|uniref:SpaA isopeptide-forming pilin-related protein n=1 Tax=Polaribacter huanghezhanensis TaxID=1354726 RepID=UPI002649B507|nr:hypothetical protein [Polaribacter huanghezhanensis]WKD85972.1 hypothetical protein KCTC32516_01321 [Polaribacter huanghezhanensis]